MDFSDIAKLIGNAAPMVATALGGPAAGAGVAMGVKLLSGLFGVKSENPTPDELHAAMIADPEMALKIKDLDYKFQMAMRQADLDELKATLADVAGSRTRQIEHEKATGHSDTNLYVLAWVIVSGFFLVIYALMSKTIPDDAQSVLFMLLGTLAAGFGSVLTYFFGSSRSSGMKDQTIANSVPINQLGNLQNGNRKMDIPK
jgi:hypothetical protein